MLPVDPIAADAAPALPARVDVVVIGGGIIGVATALALAGKGVSVALCEKGRVAAEQSGRNWGWCRTLGRDPREIPLALESLRLWRGMNHRVGAETGFREAGTLYVCDDARALAAQAAWLEHARRHQIAARLLDGDGVATILPGAARRFAGGVHTPGDGRAEPFQAVPAMARAAQARGVVIREHCAVRGIERAGGRVAGVVTEHGRIGCDAVALAGGVWSRLFCGNAGIALPQLKVLGSVLRTSPLDGPSDGAVGASDVAFRKRLDGGYTVARRNANVADIVPDSLRLLRDFAPGLRTSWHEVRLRLGRQFIRDWRVPRRWALDAPTPFERVRVLDPAPTTALLDEAWRTLTAAFPVFARARIVQRWAGLIDVTPDAVPVISAVAALPGFYLATGFSGHGFGIGPGAGRLMADLVTGDTPLVDPAPFAYGRFAGTRPPPRAEIPGQGLSRAPGG
jgi:glycine/D-amino acid oxidase-like deaminating enzyme